MKHITLVLVCCFFAAVANAVKVSSPSQLIELFSQGLNEYIKVNIELESDIDFSLVQYNRSLGTQSDSRCFPYTGTFNGNGYSIKHFKLSQGGEVGLFCQLNGATIKNLVIEESCSFTGQYAGALSAFQRFGGLTFSNVKNHASVKGQYSAGGFIGLFGEVTSNNNIKFQNCDNTGQVIGNYNGGFIGYVLLTKNTRFEFIESNNNGLLTGGSVTGGFIGSVGHSEAITTLISRCKNSGRVNGKSGSGGVIGVIEGSSGVSLTIKDSSVENTVSGNNNVGGIIGLAVKSYAISLSIYSSNVTGSTSGYNNVGGFVGNITNNDQVDISVNMSNSTGSVKGEQYVGGLFGVIQSSSPSKQTVVTITNTRRENTVIGTTLASCGFVCVEEGSTYAVKVNIFNSISHGSTQGEKAYGIANHVTEVLNVVNIGSVSGTAKSYSLWKSPITNQHAYTLSSYCKSCGTATQIAKNDKNGQYYVVGTKMMVSDMLNFVVNKGQQWKTLSFWTKDLGFDMKSDGQLSLAPSFTFSFTALLLVFFLMVQGIFTQ